MKTLSYLQQGEHKISIWFRFRITLVHLVYFPVLTCGPPFHGILPLTFACQSVLVSVKIPITFCYGHFLNIVLALVHTCLVCWLIAILCEIRSSDRSMIKKFLFYVIWHNLFSWSLIQYFLITLNGQIYFSANSMWNAYEFAIFRKHCKLKQWLQYRSCVLASDLARMRKKKTSKKVTKVCVLLPFPK